MAFSLKTLSGIALAGLLVGTGASAMTSQGDHGYANEIASASHSVSTMARATPASASFMAAQSDHDYANAITSASSSVSTMARAAPVPATLMSPKGDHSFGSEINTQG